jgi:hypothetical protein
MCVGDARRSPACTGDGMVKFPWQKLGAGGRPRDTRRSPVSKRPSSSVNGPDTQGSRLSPCAQSKSVTKVSLNMAGDGLIFDSQRNAVWLNVGRVTIFSGKEACLQSKAQKNSLQSFSLLLCCMELAGLTSSSPRGIERCDRFRVSVFFSDPHQLREGTKVKRAVCALARPP